MYLHLLPFSSYLFGPGTWTDSYQNKVASNGSYMPSDHLSAGQDSLSYSVLTLSKKIPVDIGNKI